MKFQKTIVAIVVTLVLCGTVSADSIVINDAYAYSATRSSKSGAAFLTIHNHSDEDDIFVSVSSDCAEIVQLHTHTIADSGVVRMSHVKDGFVIPANGMYSLTRGGGHIMFMGLKEPWQHEDILTVTLTFENAGEIKLNIPVDLENAGVNHNH